MVKDCPFFRIEALHLCEDLQESTKDSGSFHLLSSAKGSFVIKNANAEVTVDMGETVLIPYAAGNYTISPVKGGEKNILIKTVL